MDRLLNHLEMTTTAAPAPVPAPALGLVQVLHTHRPPAWKRRTAACLLRRRTFRLALTLAAVVVEVVEECHYRLKSSLRLKGIGGIMETVKVTVRVRVPVRASMGARTIDLVDPVHRHKVGTATLTGARTTDSVRVARLVRP